MLRITEKYISKDRRNRPGFSMVPEYITIHDTGNTSRGAGADAHANYLNSDAAANVPASWHYTVDDENAAQHLPLNEVGWHAGDGGQGPGNRKSIGIEIAMNSDGDRAKAEANAIRLVAYLVENVGTLQKFPDCMKQHYHWNGKNCPQLIRAGKVHDWSEFLNECRRLIEKRRMPMSGKYFRDVPDSHWASERINKLYELGLLSGRSENEFKPDEPITRAEAAVLIQRAIEYLEGK